MQRIEFVPTGTQPTPAQRRARRWTFAFTLLLIGAVFAAQLVVRFGDQIDVDAPTLLDVLIAKAWPALVARGKAWIIYVWLGVALTLLPLTIWYTSVVRPRGRLVIDADGIHHRPAPLPDVLQLLDPPWSISWRELRRVDFAVQGGNRGPAHMRMLKLIDDAQRRRTLRPFDWEQTGMPDPNASHGYGLVQLFSGWPKEDARFAAHPLVVALAAAGFAPQAPDPASLPFLHRAVGGSYDITTSRELQVGLGAAGAAAIYGVYELILDRFRFVGPEPEHLFVAVGLVVAGGAFAMFRATRVPLGESLVVALLVGSGIGFATRPLALRANAASDADGATVVDFRIGPGLSFEPSDPELPEFVMARQPFEYWSAFREGDRYPLTLYRGALGFWQLDTAPIRQEITRFKRFDAKHAAEARAHARRILVAGDADGR